MAHAEDWGLVGRASQMADIYYDRSFSSEIVGRMDPGDWLKVDLLENGWYAVFSPFENYRHEFAAIGFVHESRLDVQGCVETRWGSLMTSEGTVNIRSGRTTDSTVVGKINPGQRIKVDFLRSGWYAVFSINEDIRDEKLAVGYAYAPLLKPAGGNRELALIRN